jgi:hypothetical protein
MQGTHVRISRYEGKVLLHRQLNGKRIRVGQRILALQEGGHTNTRGVASTAVTEIAPLEASGFWSSPERRKMPPFPILHSFWGITKDGFFD